MNKYYIYGIGKVALRWIENGWINIDRITGFLQTEKTEDFFMNKKVFSIDEVDDIDGILIATKTIDGIYSYCIKKGIDKNKICSLYPGGGGNNKLEILGLAKTILTEEGYNRACENYGVINDDWILEDEKLYNKKNIYSNFKIEDKYKYYIYADKFNNAGNIGSYFWQDLWAAKKIINNKPVLHFDIGSRVDGFIAHLLSANVKVRLIDIRPMSIKIENLDFICADATNLDGIDDNSIESLSALCSLEHFGLGRYGDSIDPSACFKAFTAIQKKVRKDGNIYIAVPIGREHLEFNAHRVFFADTICKSFNECELMEFSSARNDIYEENIDIHKYDDEIALGGCRFGLYHFKKY